MTTTTLQEKFEAQLPLIYFSEQQFVTAQQKMMAQASDPMLKAGLEKHLEQTKTHVSNLEQVFTMLGKKPEAQKCPICEGLVKSAETGMQEAGTDALRDVYIAGSAALVEHYEIAAYRGLLAQAQALGHADAVKILQSNLNDEEMTAQKLEANAPAMMQKALVA